MVSRELIGPDLIAKMRTWRHSGFHVYVGPSILKKEDAVRVGLYIVRAPASASRLQLAEGGLLKYLAKGSLQNDRCDTLFEPAGQIFDSLEWIARVTSHIPPRPWALFCTGRRASLMHRLDFHGVSRLVRFAIKAGRRDVSGLVEQPEVVQAPFRRHTPQCELSPDDPYGLA